MMLLRKCMRDRTECATDQLGLGKFDPKRVASLQFGNPGLLYGVHGAALRHSNPFPWLHLLKVPKL